MTADVLEPRLDLLTQEYVLVQAWKKTSRWMRYHNWYADTLALDLVALNLPTFLRELAEALHRPEEWVSDPLRIVPAPKSQQWQVVVDADGRRHWTPIKGSKNAGHLRPLAHASVRDQVAATALLLCLADRVETVQGDSRLPITDPSARKKVISYGNRLFCDRHGDNLQHRWGSSKLYRGYYQDYRLFIGRPEVVADGSAAETGTRIVVVQSDLQQFYDRVTTGLLSKKLRAILQANDDERFSNLATRLLNWSWSEKDAQEVALYKQQVGLGDFSTVALPQGLVASGFFANIVLLDFDQSMRAALSSEIDPGIRLEDACRYVDDLRLVLTVRDDISLQQIEQSAVKWVQSQLDAHGPGLRASEEKTIAADVGGDEMPLVQQSRKMARIQEAISGGFDAIGGEDILNAVQGLVRAQQRYTKQRSKDKAWPFLPVPDVRDETVARFAAGRFRTTYRSLRPLLPEAIGAHTEAQGEEEGDEALGDLQDERTKADLDSEAKAFALGLIENWIENPSNVRLLRIGLDLWPAEDLLREILTLLRPFTESGGRRKAPRRVAWYCLSEILRAAATETGFVSDEESLPAGLDLEAYRALMRDEATRLAALPAARLPWYLRQQALLFLAVSAPFAAPVSRAGRSPVTKHYRELIRFLSHGSDGVLASDFATFAVLARRSFLGREAGQTIAAEALTARRLEQIAERDPSFAIDLLAIKPEIAAEVSPRMRDDLCLDLKTTDNEGWSSLATIVLKSEANGVLRNELSMLEFAAKFLGLWSDLKDYEAITPTDVFLKFEADARTVADVKVRSIRVGAEGSIYRPPQWCLPEERWRLQLGYLLRFILTAQQDFTRVVRPPHWKEGSAIYRTPESHWYQRIYGFYSGHPAFGDDWVPISDWMEEFLYALLCWPGCKISETFRWAKVSISETLRNVRTRIDELAERRGRASDLLILPISGRWPTRPVRSRSLRACIAQTVLPTPTDIAPNGLECSDVTLRRLHRRHLSAALAAIERMLDLRETHKGQERQLDWLILPELSVHPLDVRTHLVPFARRHKAIVLTGLTYESLFAGKPLVNSAVWVIPAWSRAFGLQILIRRQGKQHLAPDEESLSRAAIGQGSRGIQGFRPCQWLIGYEWSHTGEKPMWLTASICYDATDICLMADLRGQSDVFAVPALNRDTNTFDQMALALHYHMYQMVIVANNGLYGGSNAYAPYRESYVRQVFHLHGQPQASIAFLEIDDVPAFLNRTKNLKLPSLAATTASPVKWKFPPAGSWDPGKAQDA